ncbi:MAG: FAD-binding oxidoreductase [Gemmatimonadota bacterium]
MDDPLLDSLEHRVRGEVLTPGDAGYDAARAVYNGMVDRRPAAVVRALDDADVMAAIEAAQEADLPLAVRGGGHSVPGYGVCDGGITLDLSGIRNVRVDPETRTARVGGGALLGDFDHAAHAYGLATPAGFFSTTGVGGLTLGGGIGAYLSRRWGLTCDNLVSADVITSAGERVVASESRNPDLFWALRGGGGNFGVVTSFEFRMHPVDTLVAGPLVFTPESAPDVLAGWADYLKRAPRDLGGFGAMALAPPFPFLPEERHGTPVCVIMTSWVGDPGRTDEVLEPVRACGEEIGEHVGPMPYPVLQSTFDPELPPGLRQYWKADWVEALDADAAAAYAEHGARVPNALSTMHLYPMDGAVHDVAQDATAFGFRDAALAAVIVGAWEDPTDDDSVTEWVRDYHAAIHAHSGYEGGYTNYAAPDDQARVRANYGPGYDRLAEIKAHWDPDNLFRLNQNIEPAGVPAG